MRERGSGEVAGVPEHILDELVAALTDKLDVLLDRLTDRALAAPQAGTSAWREQWLDRDSPTGRDEQTRRLYVRAVLASRAGIGVHTPAVPAPIPATAPTPRARPARRRVDVNQLAMF